MRSSDPSEIGPATRTTQIPGGCFYVTGGASYIRSTATAQASGQDVTHRFLAQA